MRRKQNPRAFTLIEMAVVLALIGLLSGVTVLTLREPYRAAQFQDAVERVSFFDGHCRHEATRFSRRLTLRVDLDNERLDVLALAAEAPRLSLQLTRGVEIDQVVTGGRRFDDGQVEIPFSQTGLSSTYALLLRQGGGRSRWLLVAGVTGQQIEADHEREITEALSLAASADAD